MNYQKYCGNSFSCLIPEFCKFDASNCGLYLKSKKKDKQVFLTISLESSEALIEGIRHCIYLEPTSSEHKLIRQGAYKGKWSGIESVIESRWLHNNSTTYSWQLLLDVNNKQKIIIKLSCAGNFSEDEQDWIKVFDSIEINAVADVNHPIPIIKIPTELPKKYRIELPENLNYLEHLLSYINSLPDKDLENHEEILSSLEEILKEHCIGLNIQEIKLQLQNDMRQMKELFKNPKKKGYGAFYCLNGIICGMITYGRRSIQK